MNQERNNLRYTKLKIDTDVGDEFFPTQVQWQNNI